MGWLRPYLKVTVTVAVKEAVSRFSSLAHFVDANYASLFAMELKKLLVNGKLQLFKQPEIRYSGSDLRLLFK